MDEMRIKLGTKFMRNLVAKIIAKVVYKQCGVKVDIKLDELDICSIGGDVTARLNVEAKMKSDEFYRIMKSVDAD